MHIESLSAPLFVSWQLTRDCNLACLHCCTDSAPGRALPDELSKEEAMAFAGQIAQAGIPYVMLCGGEPTIVPHFWDVAETLGRAGVQLKIETNGQTLDRAAAERLSALPIRSVQVSVDGATPEAYARMRPGGTLEAALKACAAVREAGLPLEITFAPTRLNIHEAEAVIGLAAELKAFRFNTGKLMRMGTAAKLWDRLVPAEADYARFLALLERKERELAGRMELCYRPFTLEEGLSEAFAEPPATLQVLPDGKVKVSAPLPHVCADLKKQTLAQAWDAYRAAWGSASVREAARAVLQEPSRAAESNRWLALSA